MKLTLCVCVCVCVCVVFQGERVIWALWEEKQQGFLEAGLVGERLLAGGMMRDEAEKLWEEVSILPF